MSDFTLDCHSKIVLKLDLGDEGGVRRIRLNRLWEKNEVSFQKLRDLALELHNRSSQEVIVTYEDEDGDIITISSNDELLEAFLQFVDKVPPVLRASAAFAPIVPPPDQGKKEQGPPPEFILKVMDSINEALANAIDNFQKRKSKKEKSNSSPDRKEANSTAERTNETPEVEQPCVKKEVDFVEMNFGAAASLKKDPVAVEEEKRPKAEEKKPVAEMKKPEAEELKPNAEDKKPEAEDKKPRAEPKKALVGSVPSYFDIKFIHGRHTCDGCLITPIVGLRYHAANLPDYDLCQKCVLKAKDKHNVLFEPCQNERDMPFQYRWERRQQRLSRQAGNCKYTNIHRHQQEKDKVAEVEEDELKEAIRQSLLVEEAKKKPSESKIQEPPVKEHKENDAQLQESDNLTPVPDKGNSMSAENIASIVACFAASLETETSPTVSEQQELNNQIGEDVAVADASTHSELFEEVNPEISTLDSDISSRAKSVPTMKKEKEIVETVAYDSDVVARKEDIEIVTLSSAISDMSTSELVHQEDLLEEIETINSEDHELVLVNDEDHLPKPSEIETSFVSDAEGQGDMALAIGETLDKCASEINAIVAEVASLEDENTNNMDDCEKSSVSSFQSQDHDIISEAGRTILDAVPTYQEDDALHSNKTSASSAEDEWQVLEDSQQIQDEMIARAAQLLGSVLFSSSLNSEELAAAVANENDSNQNHHDETSCLTSGGSVVSSVPHSQSNISLQVVARWDKELIQLHELGFLDDHKNVDTLERLEAANIGIDSKDPVTVEQVVNELLMSTDNKDVN